MRCFIPLAVLTFLTLTRGIYSASDSPVAYRSSMVDSCPMLLETNDAIGSTSDTSKPSPTKKLQSRIPDMKRSIGVWHKATELLRALMPKPSSKNSDANAEWDTMMDRVRKMIQNGQSIEQIRKTLNVLYEMPIESKQNIGAKRPVKKRMLKKVVFHEELEVSDDHLNVPPLPGFESNITWERDSVETQNDSDEKMSEIDAVGGDSDEKMSEIDAYVPWINFVGRQIKANTARMEFLSVFDEAMLHLPSIKHLDLKNKFNKAKIKATAQYFADITDEIKKTVRKALKDFDEQIMDERNRRKETPGKSDHEIMKTPTQQKISKKRRRKSRKPGIILPRIPKTLPKCSRGGCKYPTDEKEVGEMCLSCYKKISMQYRGRLIIHTDMWTSY